MKRLLLFVLIIITIVSATGIGLSIYNSEDSSPRVYSSYVIGVYSNNTSSYFDMSNYVSVKTQDNKYFSINILGNTISIPINDFALIKEKLQVFINYKDNLTPHIIKSLRKELKNSFVFIYDAYIVAYSYVLENLKT